MKSKTASRASLRFPGNHGIITDAQIVANSSRVDETQTTEEERLLKDAQTSANCRLRNGIQEVVGSIPIGSTNTPRTRGRSDHHSAHRAHGLLALSGILFLLESWL